MSRHNAFTIPKLIAFVVVCILISSGFVYAGYRGYGPLAAYYEPPSVNLLVEDTGDYVLYQTQRQAQSKIVKGFAINKKTGKRVRVNNLATLVAPKAKEVTSSKINLQTNPAQYADVVNTLSQVISSCRIEGRAKGEDLKNCLCESVDCKNNPLMTNFAKNVAATGTNVGKFDCVEYVQLVNEFNANPLLAQCNVTVANQLTPATCLKMAKQKGETLNSYSCNTSKIKQNGFKVGDLIVQQTSDLNKTGHVSVCVETASDGSCRVCESNYNNNGQVSCDRVIAKNSNSLATIWRSNRDEQSQCFIPR